jgi:hypothetical protein
MLLILLVIMIGWQQPAYGDINTNANQVYDIKQFWPFPDKIFRYQHYDSSGQPIPNNLERIWHERWEDGQHFTIHHWWDTWCPRIDDVMVWEDDRLYYTDTYDFARSHHTRLEPGHLWADRWMEVDGPAQFNDVEHRVFRIGHTNCAVTSSVFDPSESHNNRIWRRLLGGLSDWSPFTGGSDSPVPILRLDETTLINNNPEDWFKEEWYFYKHSVLGWIAIHSKGYRVQPGNTTPEVLWDARLMGVEDLPLNIKVFAPLVTRPS